MSMEQSVYLIPFLAITLGIGMIVTVIVTMHRAKMRELDHRHQERMAAIEKGLDPALEPGEPVHQETHRHSSGRPPSGYLLRGLIWLGVGLAIAMGRGAAYTGVPQLFGWIAAAVGAAYLIYYSLEGRNAPPPPPPPSQLPPGS